MSRVAVIGAGISGMAAAYYLSRRHEVWLFEREPRLGGHTHTVRVDTSRGSLQHRHRVHRLQRAELPEPDRAVRRVGGRVAAERHVVFGIELRDRVPVQQPRRQRVLRDRANLFRVAHYRLLADIGRFHRRARRLLPGAAAAAGRGAGSEEPGGGPSLEEWLEQERFSESFRTHFLYPMIASIVDGPRPGRGIPGADDGAVLRQPRPPADGGEPALARRARWELDLHPAADPSVR